MTTDYRLPEQGNPTALPSEGKYPGLYRGIVTEIDDRPPADGGNSKPPIGDDKGPLGRVRVRVWEIHSQKDVVDDDLPWAEVAFPFGGGPDEDDRLSGIFFEPPVGQPVWVMFVHGDPQYPVIVGGRFGKKDDKVEIPREAVDASRAPYETEEERTQVTYPLIYVIKPPGQRDTGEDGMGMCIRFVDDKRVDIMLDENNWIELDDGGSPGESEPDLQPAMIRVHSSDRRIAVTSNFADDKAILMLANAGGIQIEAERNIILASRAGNIGMIAGKAAAAASAQAKIEAAAPDSPRLNPAETLAVGSYPIGGSGNIVATGEGDRLDYFGKGSITHQAPRITAAGSVAGCYYHPPLGGHC